MEETNFASIYIFISTFLIYKGVCSLDSPLKYSSHLTSFLLHELNKIFNICSFLNLYENHDFKKYYLLTHSFFLYLTCICTVLTVWSLKWDYVLMSTVLNRHYKPEYLGSLVTFDQLILMLTVSSLPLLFTIVKIFTNS